MKIPADAQAGEYSGTITVSATGKEAISVPLALTVFDWSLPSSSEQLTACMDIVQSPDSVAMAYNVPMWSEAHLKLLDKSFSLLAPLAVKTLYIPCIRRTHFGNEHAMVRWIRNDAGELEPDFSVAEKYLDLAMKHLGRIPGVIFYCWEPPESMGHAGTGATDIHDRIPLITLFDPASGRELPRQGPGFGTPESKAFWKRLTDGAMAMLRKRGLENSMYIGLIGDHRPTKLAMDDIGNGLARPRWALHSHIYAEKWQGHEIGFITALWGVSYSPADPSSGYCFGWSNPLWVNYYPREMSLTSTLTEHRIKLENYLGARRAYTPFVAKGMGVRGLGRLGADFWNVLRDERGRPRGSLAGRYPESYWGQLNLNYGIPYLLGRGREGPVATIRSEAFR
ncbi:MAG: glycoside hydrolase domain-containing protein [Kiritimatiellia bacterium]